MNEHIKEMARQAGGIDMTNHAAGGISTWIGTGTSEFIEQFADLIVQECLTKIEEAAEYSPELYGVALDIQEHFGVNNE